MIRSFKHKGLADLYYKGKAAKVRADLQVRVLRRLDPSALQGRSLVDAALAATP